MNARVAGPREDPFFYGVTPQDLLIGTLDTREAALTV